MASFDNLLNKSYSQLQKIYKKLAKRADQRLVRLEKFSEKQPSVLDWAYRKALYDIELYSGKGRRRFNVGMPKTEKQLRRKIAAIQNFLEAPTSTVQGIHKIEKNRVDAINAKFGTDFSMKDWEKLHQSGVYAKAIEKYGFYTATEALGAIEKDAEELILMKQEADELGMSLSEILGEQPIQKYDAVLKEVITDILEKEGLNLKDLK